MDPSFDLDVLLIGHAAKDRNVVDGVGRTEAGGGVYFASTPLRRLGLRVAIATRLHPDDLPLLDLVKQEGVQVYAAPAAQTSGIENTYDSTDMERRVCKPLGFAGTMRPEDIPDLSARIYAVVPIIAGEVDLPLLQMLARRGPVALDVQGFVRVPEGENLVFRPWQDMEEGLACVTYLKVDRAEAEHLTGQTDLEAALHHLSAYGPSEVLVTQSSGLTVLAQGHLHRAPFTPRSMEGRTGRGDTCFATYLGKRLTASVDQSARLAAAVTSLKQERPGPWLGSLVEAEALAAGMM